MNLAKAPSGLQRYCLEKSEYMAEGALKWFNQVISALSSSGWLKFVIGRTELFRAEHVGCLIPGPLTKAGDIIHMLGEQNPGHLFRTREDKVHECHKGQILVSAWCSNWTIRVWSCSGTVATCEGIFHALLHNVTQDSAYSSEPGTGEGTVE